MNESISIMYFFLLEKSMGQSEQTDAVDIKKQLLWPISNRIFRTRAL